MPSAAQITPSPLMPEAAVRKHLELAIQASLKAQHRLARLTAAPDAEQQWEQGAESAWFFEYSDRKLRKLLQTFSRVAEILQHPNLKIHCDDKFPKYGEAHPAIKRIKLGKDWAEADAFERTQSLIHEASHIVGRFIINEGAWYGQQDSQYRAAKSWVFHMRVTRNADSVGYYAMDVAAGKVTTFQ